MPAFGENPGVFLEVNFFVFEGSADFGVSWDGFAFALVSRNGTVGESQGEGSVGINRIATGGEFRFGDFGIGLAFLFIDRFGRFADFAVFGFEASKQHDQRIGGIFDPLEALFG